MDEKILRALTVSESLPSALVRQAGSREDMHWVQSLEQAGIRYPWQTNIETLQKAARISDVSRYLKTSGARGVHCDSCGAWNPEYNRDCSVCGEGLADVTPVDQRKPIGQPISLITINEDGSDGRRISLEYEETVLGRDADFSFPKDLFLSPRHALLTVKEGTVYVEDLKSLNGTFVKLQVPVRLNSGDVLLMGRQVLRFCRATDTRSARVSDNEGTRYMGSPHPTGNNRLEQIGVGGYTLDVYSVSSEGATIGRERGDIVFPRDKFMSSTHARIAPVKNGEGFALEDLNSSNGTWLRTNRPTRLNKGDFLFLGQQLFRIAFE